MASLKSERCSPPLYKRPNSAKWMQHKSFECDLIHRLSHSQRRPKQTKEGVVHRVNRREIPQVAKWASSRKRKTWAETSCGSKYNSRPILAESCKCSLYIGARSNRIKNPESSPEPDKNARVKCVWGTYLFREEVLTIDIVLYFPLLALINVWNSYFHHFNGAQGRNPRFAPSAESQTQIFTMNKAAWQGLFVHSSHNLNPAYQAGTNFTKPWTSHFYG